jgi:hypothetical protein
MGKEGCIYLVTCLVNNKKYVGQHNRSDPEKRWAVHIRDMKHGSELPFHSALRKHGIDNFDFDVIYTGPLESLDIMELYFAEHYESYIWNDSPGGYNLRMCGNFPMGTKADMDKVKEYINIEDTSKELSLQRRTSLYGTP